jgi:hypothetical protein
MSEATKTWPDLAVGLYDRLTGRGSEITYELDNVEIHVPDKVGEDAEFARWRVNGALKIRTKDNQAG